MSESEKVREVLGPRLRKSTSASPKRGHSEFSVTNDNGDNNNRQRKNNKHGKSPKKGCPKTRQESPKARQDRRQYEQRDSSCRLRHRSYSPTMDHSVDRRRLIDQTNSLSQLFNDREPLIGVRPFTSNVPEPISPTRYVSQQRSRSQFAPSLPPGYNDDEAVDDINKLPLLVSSTGPAATDYCHHPTRHLQDYRSRDFSACLKNRSSFPRKLCVILCVHFLKHQFFVTGVLLEKRRDVVGTQRLYVVVYDMMQ